MRPLSSPSCSCRYPRAVEPQEMCRRCEPETREWTARYFRAFALCVAGNEPPNDNSESDPRKAFAALFEAVRQRPACLQSESVVRDPSLAVPHFEKICRSSLERE